MKRSSRRPVNFRPLTRNEKVLIIVLGFILILWTSFNFLFDPQNKKVKYLKLEKAKYLEIIEEQNGIVKSEGSIKNELTKLQVEKKNILSKYFSILDQSQILYILEDVMKEEKVNIMDLRFARPYIETKGDMEVQKMDINMPFNGSYDGIMDILETILNSSRGIVVESLVLEGKDSNVLTGSINLNVYSLEKLGQINKDLAWVDVVDRNQNATPFIPYGDYREANNGQENMDQISDREEDVSIQEKEEDLPTRERDKDLPVKEIRYIKEVLEVEKDSKEKVEDTRKLGQTICDFDSGNYQFIPANSLVKGRVLSSNIKKSGKGSLRLEYNILALEDDNRAYIDLSSNNINLKVAPESLGIWVYSYGYSPGTLGMRLKGQAGEEIDINIMEGISWTGWQYIETNIPKTIKFYPLTVDKLFFEIPYEREGIGVLLFDKLEVFYTNNGDDSTGQHQFYVVKEGDNISDISNKIYGTPVYKNEIMELNEIKTGDVLHVGMVLILKSH